MRAGASVFREFDSDGTPLANGNFLRSLEPLPDDPRFVDDRFDAVPVCPLSDASADPAALSVAPVAAVGSIS